MTPVQIRVLMAFLLTAAGLIAPGSAAQARYNTGTPPRIVTTTGGHAR